MAGQASPRIVVASAVRELAKHVQRQMPKASVENVVDYNGESKLYYLKLSVLSY